jgi:phage regulator Rha-like protein
MQLQTTIQNQIIEIRQQKVMLDVHLAALYGVETKVFNQAVKRNIERFPEEFMFQLTDNEWKNLKSQIVTSSWGGTRKLPYAFTEHGVTMAASILKSSKAIQMNINIIKAFISMKKFVLHQQEVTNQLENLKNKLQLHDEQLNQIYDTIENLLDDKIEQQTWQNRKRIGFKP